MRYVICYFSVVSLNSPLRSLRLCIMRVIVIIIIFTATYMCFSFNEITDILLSIWFPIQSCICIHRIRWYHKRSTMWWIHKIHSVREIFSCHKNIMKTYSCKKMTIRLRLVLPTYLSNWGVRSVHINFKYLCLGI